MARNTAESYIKYEIQWFEEKVKQLRDYIDDNPFHSLEDRTETFITTKGIPTIKIVATKEDQLKILKDILKDLPAMFEALERLREKDIATKIELRGGSQASGIMKKHLEEINTNDK